MRKIIIIICLALQALQLNAQTFQSKDSISIESGKIESFHSLDLTNDAISDLLVMAKKDGKYQLLFSDGNSVKFDTVQMGTITSSNIYLADMNNNTRLDIIFQSLIEEDTVLLISYHLQPMVFSEPEIIDNVRFRQIEAADIDSDGIKELVYTDLTGQLKVRKADSLGWVDFNSEINFQAEEWMLFDSNNNGFKDLLRVQNNKVLLNQWETKKWNEKDSIIFEGQVSELSYGDINGDSDNDIVLYGSQDGINFYLFIITRQSTTEIELASLTEVNTYLHDFNTDGLADVLVSGQMDNDSSFVKLFVNKDNTLTADSIDYVFNFQQLTVNDTDFDGDLDIIIDDGLSKITRIDNITEVKNLGPTVVPNHFAFVNGRRVVIHWDSSSDDFTDSTSLTYDVAIGDDFTNAKYLGSNFDLTNFYRLFSSVGNSGLNNEIGINRDLENGIYFYCIQSVDNALHFLSGIGNGPSVAFGQFMICEENRTETKYACEGESIEIVTEEPFAYYSELKGYLGFTDTLVYVVDQNDIIITGQQQEADCASQIIYEIEILDTSDIIEAEYIAACIDDNVVIDIEEEFERVEWSFNGVLVSESFDYQFTASESGVIGLKAFRSDCLQTDSVRLIVGNPIIKARQNDYTINKGESITLDAEAYNYESIEWTPSIGLDNSTILNPIASPVKTQKYQLTITDSIGCSSQDQFEVIVLENGWIPDLFTPNDDGNNDILLIYGLGEVSNVKLEIYNRSGDKVFESTDLNMLQQKGWDGTKSGQKQPNGLYYWKITGLNADGSQVKLNGKSDGVIYLMR